MTYAGNRQIYDADSHLMELPDFLSAHAEASVARALPDLPAVLAGGQFDPSLYANREGHDANTVAKLTALGDNLTKGPKWHDALGAFSGAERSRALDLLGFERQIIFSSFCARLIFAAVTDDIGYGAAAAHNPRARPERVRVQQGWHADHVVVRHLPVDHVAPDLAVRADHMAGKPEPERERHASVHRERADAEGPRLGEEGTSFDRRLVVHESDLRRCVVARRVGATHHAWVLRECYPRIRYHEKRYDPNSIVRVMFTILPNLESLRCFEAVATHPQARRRGLAKRVLSTLLDWSRSEGATAACLQVLSDNEPAIALYRSLGFERCVYRYSYYTA